MFAFGLKGNSICKYQYATIINMSAREFTPTTLLSCNRATAQVLLKTCALLRSARNAKRIISCQNINHYSGNIEAHVQETDKNEHTRVLIWHTKNFPLNHHSAVPPSTAKLRSYTNI